MRLISTYSGELNYLTPHAFWNISDFGAKCEKCGTTTIFWTYVVKSGMKIISLITTIFYVDMKKDFIVSKIEAPQNGSQYVLVAFSDPNMTVYLSGRLNENLPKIISSVFGEGDSPTFKITMKEYEDMAIKVGDKIRIEIKKTE
jgi:hypothetical protein